MRVLKEIPMGDIKASIFFYNNKYLLKLEQGLVEQTFKVPETEITGEQDLEAMLTEAFIAKARLRFKDMMADLQAALF